MNMITGDIQKRRMKVVTLKKKVPTNPGFTLHHPVQGFTLLEILIVISIIAVLSVIVILVLNPSEILKKARDSQRMADLNTIKTALGYYLTNSNTPYLGVGGANTGCVSGTNKYVWFSKSGLSSTLDGVGPATSSASQALAGNVDGTGWVPVNLKSLSGGSPISNWPVDPVNSVASSTSPMQSDLVYRYGCNASNQFEVDATLESKAYTTDDNKSSSDGGDNPNLYEAGTSLSALNLTCDPTVTYAGQTYQTVYIGNQCWFKQNLNVGTPLADASTMPTLGNGSVEKWCYNNDVNICNTDGGLYTWAEANQLGVGCDTASLCQPSLPSQGICPVGWHIPSDAEFKTLEIFLGMSPAVVDNINWRGTDQGSQLSTQTLNGTNSSGFTALMAGIRAIGNTYLYRTNNAYFWTASEISTTDAWPRALGSLNAQVYRLSYAKTYGWSVRCVKN